MLFWFLAGCSGHPLVDQVLVLDRDEDGSYGLVPRELSTLEDRQRLVGPEGHGYRGGLLDAGGYREGGSLDIAWVDEGGVGVSVDEDGLILWSFYGQLAGAWQDLEDRGYQGPERGVAIAYNPVSVMDFQAAENAAYATSMHTFLLFPDMLQHGVPLAANAGVVRHEFGHAWFHALVVGDPHASPAWIDDGVVAEANAVAALNEGFADTTATLLLDDPAFIEASLDMPSRDVRGDWAAAPEDYPDPDAELNLLDMYDPYVLGTVFASMAWDVREATDPDTALDLAVRSLTTWGEEADWLNIDRYAVIYAELAASDPLAGPAACASLAARFPHVEEPPSCAR
ncbi:MAG: hypothetical protein JXX28_12780 [Deltaproteobacteria bacterium]|nr:hypothetical protein [Deltaproteobacteria bacterium]